MSHIPWPDIEGFHTVRKSVQKYPELLGGADLIRYRAKVKLHGTNAAVQLRDGKVFAQSRTQIISPTSDNAGFAAWVESRKAEWNRVEALTGSVIVFGEWCGPGIMKGVAINKAPNKVFAIFAAARLPFDAEGKWIVDPVALEAIAEHVHDAYALPWHRDAFDIPLLAEADALQPILDDINREVEVIEGSDPWVRETFGIDGTGEGLVFYPSDEHITTFKNLMFKAKGEKHKTVAKSAPAQVDAAVAESIEAFATMMLTAARLEQGARAAAGGDLVFEKRLIGPFMAWVAKDVEKESAAELEASSLTWKQVAKAVTDAARRWYLAKAEAL
ncbi:MAG TPA: RNA ligase family protein [Thermoanaerobaculia bacterium]|jgi:hypothetical protein|nr:RNA ligase family protein [Thermoanaerobaculia bacterium]